jgi:LytS/YehU family sensor histidine kinase
MPIERIAIAFFLNGLIFLGWSLAYFWITAENEKKYQSERLAKTKAEKLKVELQKLRLQLNPHFLFNTLNGVIEEIPENPAAALSMLQNLTMYLRYSLNSIDNTIVDVQTEIEAINNYLAIQKTRFGPRLRCQVHVAPDASARPIVSFLLQPIVENAIKHGNRDNIMDLNVDVIALGSDLKIEVRNTGTLKKDYLQNNNRNSIGLVNLNQRLVLHYPNRHQFLLCQVEKNLVSASLILENNPCSGS